MTFPPLGLKPLTFNFMLIMLLLLLFLPATAQAEINLEPGNPAPGFFLYDLDGKEHFLSDFVGKPRNSIGKPLQRKPVLLNFFGVNCKPCEAEIPYLRQLAARYQKEGLVVLLASKDPRFMLEKYVSQRQLSLPVLIDEYEQVHNKYLVSAIPVLYLIAPDGSILLRRFGFDTQDNAQLELALLRLFRKSPATQTKPTPQNQRKKP